MKTAIVVHCEWLGGERWLTLEELAQAAGASPSFVRTLWEEGLIEAGQVEAGAPRFEGVALRPHTGAMEKNEVLASNAEKIRKALKKI